MSSQRVCWQLLIPGTVPTQQHTEHGQARYRLRQQTAEPMFGYTKHNRRSRQFRRRGRSVARSEWRFVAAMYNLVKLHNHRVQPTTG
jgi:Transposase DDE domain